MELKNAFAVCLIAFFSATLVLLIARALDMQAASQLQPHLAQIAEELRALRKQGGFAPGHSIAGNPTPAASEGANNPVGASSANSSARPSDEVLVVYYFHGSQRCPTCLLIESLTREIVESYFSDQVRQGTVVFKSVNFEQPSYAALAREFNIAMPMVVLAAESNHQVKRWRSLPSVWMLVRDRAAFAKYVREQIESMLPASKAAASSSSAGLQPTASSLAPGDPRHLLATTSLRPALVPS